MIGSADQKLGEDAFFRFETLRTRLGEIRKQWWALRQDIEVPTTPTDWQYA